MFEELTKKAIEALFDQGFLGVLLFLSWFLHYFDRKWLIGQIEKAERRVDDERADHKVTIAKQREDILNLAKVPASVDNLIPMMEMLLRNNRGGN